MNSSMKDIIHGAEGYKVGEFSQGKTCLNNHQSVITNHQTFHSAQYAVLLIGEWKRTLFKKIFSVTSLPEAPWNRLWCFMTASKLEKNPLLCLTGGLLTL